MSSGIPDFVKEKLNEMPEYKYGVNRVIVTLADNRVFAHVHIAWTDEIVKVEGYDSIPFDEKDIVDVKNDI